MKSPPSCKQKERTDMAKKKQALSPEERLAAALVPEEEQPYALPDGWKWVYLSGILDVSKEKTEEFPVVSTLMCKLL